jgi:hypothetical protein
MGFRTIIISLGLTQALIVKQDIQEQIFSVNVRKKFEYFGGNDFFVTEGSANCRLKSTSNNMITDAQNGQVMIDLDPADEYSANVVVQCQEGEKIEETNSFSIKVLCREDTPNMEFSDVVYRYSQQYTRGG